MAQVLNIEMERGDTVVVRGFLTDENGVAINDATAAYKLVARATRNAADPAVFTKTGSQFVAGEGRCTILPADTNSFTDDRSLYYDMQVTETAGQVTTLLKGKLTVFIDAARP